MYLPKHRALTAAALLDLQMSVSPATKWAVGELSSATLGVVWAM
jgi:hypothetical protein